MHRRSLLAASAGLVAAGLAGCGTSGPAAPTAPDAQKATIGLSYIPNIQFAPFYTADVDGMFARRGVQATLRHHGANEGLFTAIAGGQEDFLIAGGDELLQAREQGMDLVAVASYYRAYPVTLIVKDSSPIRTPTDLAGRTVGLPGRYGESWFGLRVALAGAGLTEERVKVLEIGYTQQAALTTDKVDAVVGFSNNDVVQFGLAGVGVRQVPLAPQIPLVSISLLTTRANLTGKPDLVRQVADGMVDGIEAVRSDPARAVEVAKKHVPTLAVEQQRTAARATLDATLPLWVPGGRASGRLDPAQWQAMSRFMADQGLTKAPVDPAAAVAPDVVSR
ncbi:ABC transporter substrate-binding protein [Mariniluteicoccus flavus]